MLEIALNWWGNVLRRWLGTYDGSLWNLAGLSLEWSATDSAWIVRHTQTVPEDSKDNIVLFGLRHMTWRFRYCLDRKNSVL